MPPKYRPSAKRNARIGWEEEYLAMTVSGEGSAFANTLTQYIMQCLDDARAARQASVFIGWNRDGTGVLCTYTADGQKERAGGLDIPSWMAELDALLQPPE